MPLPLFICSLASVGPCVSRGPGVLELDDEVGDGLLGFGYLGFGIPWGIWDLGKRVRIIPLICRVYAAVARGSAEASVVADGMVSARGGNPPATAFDASPLASRQATY